MHMGLRDANHTGESSLRQFAIVYAIPDVGEQSLLRVLEGQVGVSSYFKLK
jgi:hypothetical protein